MTRRRSTQQAPMLRLRSILWPKWHIQCSDGHKFPTELTGPQCGTTSDQGYSYNAHGFESASKEALLVKDSGFQADEDVLFINNYVFEHCEIPDTKIYFPPEPGLPEDLQCVRQVGLHASALSMGVEEGDIVWGKQLRFILTTFPSVQVILVLTTTVLDMYRPSACPLPYEVFHHTEAIHPEDQSRLGIVDSAEQGKICKFTGRPNNFLIQAWDDVKTEWPSYRTSRGARKLGPLLAIAGLVFFAREWANMERRGEHGRSCRIEESRLPVGPIRTAVKMERAARVPRGLHENERSQGKRPEGKSEKTKPGARLEFSKTASSGGILAGQ